MIQRLLNTTTKKTLPHSISTITPRQQYVALFGTSSTQWFRRFLTPGEEKQLYLGITSLFREKLKEKSTPSNQSYSNMIDQVIMGTQSTTTTTTTTSGGFDYAPATPLILQQLGHLKHELEDARKTKDLARLEILWQQLQQAGQQIPTTMYNHLIRGFLACPQGLTYAKFVVDTMHSQQQRLPTTRTCTYMIQAYLKRQLPLEEARPYVAMLHHYSLNKLRNPFDCSVMLRYYVDCGNAHAIDFLWRDTMRYVDVIQPGPALYTQYVDWLLSSQASVDLVADAARSLVARYGAPPLSEDSTTTTTQQHSPWPDHQIATWLNAVRLLAHSKDGSSSYCTDAEKLMLCLVNVTDSITSPTTAELDNLNSSPTAETTGTSSLLTLTRIQGKQAIQDIITTYLTQAQDLKVLAFYYRLRKSGVNEEAFGNDLTRAIGKVIGRVEIQQEWNTVGSKAIVDEFGLVSRS